MREHLLIARAPVAAPARAIEKAYAYAEGRGIGGRVRAMSAL
jgi:hypothetical protein